MKGYNIIEREIKNISNYELIERFRRTRELPLFDELYRRFSKGVFAYLYKIFEEVEVCEDILQEVFFRVYKYIRKYDAKYSFTTWLYTIAKNRAIRYLKKRVKDKELQEKLIFEVEESVSFEDSVVSQLSIERIVSMLPEENRIVFSGKYIDGKSDREIADIIGKTERTVRNIHARNREIIKNMLVVEKEGI